MKKQQEESSPTISSTTELKKGTNNSKKGKGKNGTLSQGFEITIEAPKVTTETQKSEKTSKKKETEVKVSPSSSKEGKTSKKKGEKLPEDVQKLLQDWEIFEKNLEKKRKLELRKGRSRSSTFGSGQLPTLEQMKNDNKSAESSPKVQRKERALSVSDGIELAAKKLQQRKQRNKKANDQLKEIQAEQKEEEDLADKKQQTEGDENAGKLRQWKQHMNVMKTKSREDYVTFYKTINKKNDNAEVKQKQVIILDDNFVHYYLALRSDSK